MAMPQNEIVTTTTFLSATEMREKYYIDDMNTLLTTISQRLVQAKRNPTIRLLQADLQIYPPEIITNVKYLLQNKGYIITDTEDATGLVLGFKVTVP